MIKMTIVQRIEQILRGICFFVYLFGVCCILIVEPLFRPIYPSIDSFTGHYFSKNFKQGLVNEYIVKYWCKGVFQLFGINVINEFKVSFPFSSALYLQFSRVFLPSTEKIMPSLCSLTEATLIPSLFVTRLQIPLI